MEHGHVSPNLETELSENSRLEEEGGVGTNVGGPKEESLLFELENNQALETIEGSGKGHYVCKFCSKVFDKHQALGGHMNGHSKDQRNFEKFGKVKTWIQKTYPTLIESSSKIQGSSTNGGISSTYNHLLEIGDIGSHLEGKYTIQQSTQQIKMSQGLPTLHQHQNHQAQERQSYQHQQTLQCNQFRDRQALQESQNYQALQEHPNHQTSQGFQNHLASQRSQSHQTPQGSQYHKGFQSSQAPQGPQNNRPSLESLSYQAPQRSQSSQAPQGPQSYKPPQASPTYQAPQRSQSSQVPQGPRSYKPPQASLSYQPPQRSHSYPNSQRSQGYQAPQGPPSYRPPQVSPRYQGPQRSQSQNYQAPQGPWNIADDCGVVGQIRHTNSANTSSSFNPSNID